MKIYLITRKDLPVGAYRTRDAAKEAALSKAAEGVKFTDHAWTYSAGVDGDGRRTQVEDGPSLDRAELSYRSARRWINSGYVIDSTELHA
ncbi:hypothetical protein [Streptomyces sp. NPDC051994]|uniref:hypothetical protein n=1 Tax=unclassified Streptomyces TaxID=2593676 RepID=UPI003428E07B